MTCVNEIIVDRLLTLLEVEHLHYQLIHADILVEGIEYGTYLCASEDFKNPKESKTALDNYYRVNALPGESHYDFCKRNGWKESVDTMLAIDFIILFHDLDGILPASYYDTIWKMIYERYNYYEKL